MKVSAVLRECANTWLVRGPGLKVKKPGETSEMICCALINGAEAGYLTLDDALAAVYYLSWLGMGTGFGVFRDWRSGPDRQAVRHAWLLQAARCWDEGIRP